MRTSWSEELDPRNAGAVAAIDASAGVVFGSPVYRASIPGVLKNLIDHLSVESLRDKPVALIVVGARPHHYLGVDRHMRDILAWFGALALPTSATSPMTTSTTGGCAWTPRPPSTSCARRSSRSARTSPTSVSVLRPWQRPR